MFAIHTHPKIDVNSPRHLLISISPPKQPDLPLSFDDGCEPAN